MQKLETTPDIKSANTAVGPNNGPAHSNTSTGDTDLQSPELPLPVGKHNLETEMCLPVLKGKRSLTDFTLDLLKLNRGVFIGEEHNDQITPDSVAQSMSRYAQAGVTTLGIEMIKASDQHLVDAYFDSPNQANAQALKSKMMFKGARFNIVEAAREAGIKVVGIDVPRSETLSNGQYVGFSSEKVNSGWARAMEAGHKKGKFVAYGGLYHSRTDGSGVNNYLNVPSIVPVDPNTSKSSEYSLNGGPIVQPGVAKKGEYEYRATTSFEQYATQAEKYFNSKMRSDVSEAFSRLADDLRKYTAGKGSEGRALLKPVHSLKEMTQDSRLDQMVLSQMIKELSS